MGLYYAQAGLDQSLRLGVNVAKRVGLLSERIATAAPEKTTAAPSVASTA